MIDDWAIWAEVAVNGYEEGAGAGRGTSYISSYQRVLLGVNRRDETVISVESKETTCISDQRRSPRG